MKRKYWLKALILAQKGTDVYPEFPSSGMYAVGIAW